jgi:uncharacterized protein (UPF0333 family)
MAGGLKERENMRGALLVGILVVLLIIGFLVMKNMGGEQSAGPARTQAKQTIERAETAAKNVGKEMKSLQDRIGKAGSTAQ